MKLTKAEENILWQKVQQNMELVQKITQDLQTTTATKSFRGHGQNHNNLQPIKDVRITRKTLDLNFREQESKAEVIRNKLAYMRLSQHKEERALDLAKKNMLRLTSIRRNSLRERETLNKLRENFNMESSAQIFQRAQTIKSERKNREEAIEKWKKSLKQTAGAIRIQNNQFHTISAQEKRIERDINSRKAERIRENLQKSRMTIQQSYVFKIQSTRSRARRDLESRYRKLNQQKKSNERLFDVLRSETEKLTQWQNRKKREMQEFKSMWIRCKENPQSNQIQLCRSNVSFS